VFGKDVIDNPTIATSARNPSALRFVLLFSSAIAFERTDAKLMSQGTCGHRKTGVYEGGVSKSVD
jgi:hypothetical protein